MTRGRAHYAEAPTLYAERNPGAPGSAAARQRAVRARQTYEGLRPEIVAFRQLPGVEIVPSRAFMAAKAGTDQRGPSSSAGRPMLLKLPHLRLRR